MPTFSFYVSDYGLGHATRSIGLIRRILSRYPGSRIFVRSDGPYDLLARSLPDPRVSVGRCRNDIDVPLLPGTDAVDRDRTRDRVLGWMESWDAFVTGESRFCTENSVDLVLSDIAPQPFLVASGLGIPSVAVSNFSWDTIFSPLFPDPAECIQRMRSAYSQATCACVLPFHLPMDAFPRKVPVSLLAREVTISRDRMREMLGLNKDDTVVYFNPRGPVDQPGPDFFTTLASESIRILMPSASALRHPRIIALPGHDTESQNWVAICDCAVTRCGYSTVSEAVQASVPLIVWERPGFVEDTAIAGEIKRLGVGRSMSYPQVRSLDWVAELPELSRYKHHYVHIHPNYKNSGSDDILSLLQECIA